MGLAIAVAACATARYQPTQPMRARAGDLSLDLAVVLVRTSGQGFLFQADSTAPHGIQAAWLTVASRAPCSGGQESEELAVDGASGTGILPQGRHELRVEFPGAVPQSTFDLVVDLALDRGGCARVPAISRSIPLTAVSGPVLVGSMGVNGNSDLLGFRAVTWGSVGAGGWLGPVLLTGEVGLGLTYCEPSVCGKDADGDLHSELTFPVAAEVRYPLWAGTTNRLVHAFMLGARYSYLPIRLPTLTGDRHLGTHGFEGTLSWGFRGPVSLRGNFQRLERTTLSEIVIPIGVRLAGDGSGKVAFTGGFAFRWLFPL
jgi:hypothetical protein